FPLEARAVVIDVAAPLDFSHQRTTAMTTLDESGECEIALGFPIPAGVALVQHLLHALPKFPADERLVVAPIGLSLPVEVAGVDAVVQNVVDRGAGHGVPAAGEAQPRGASHTHDLVEGVSSGGIPFIDPRDQWSEFRVRLDDLLAVRSNDVAIA